MSRIGDMNLSVNATNVSYEIKKDFTYCGINDCPGKSSGESSIPPDMETVF